MARVQQRAPRRSQALTPAASRPPAPARARFGRRGRKRRPPGFVVQPEFALHQAQIEETSHGAVAARQAPLIASNWQSRGSRRQVLTHASGALFPPARSTMARGPSGGAPAAPKSPARRPPTRRTPDGRSARPSRAAAGDGPDRTGRSGSTTCGRRPAATGLQVTVPPHEKLSEAASPARSARSASAIRAPRARSAARASVSWSCRRAAASCWRAIRPAIRPRPPIASPRMARAAEPRPGYNRRRSRARPRGSGSETQMSIVVMR